MKASLHTSLVLYFMLFSLGCATNENPVSGEQGQIRVNSPNGGEILIKGTKYAITWTSQNLTGNVQIDLFKGGSNFLSIAADALNTGSRVFDPSPSLPDGQDYRVRVSSKSGGVSDFSDANFELFGLPGTYKLSSFTDNTGDLIAPGFTANAGEAVNVNIPGLGVVTIVIDGNLTFTTNRYTFNFVIITNGQQESNISTGVYSFRDDKLTTVDDQGVTDVLTVSVDVDELTLTAIDGSTVLVLER